MTPPPCMDVILFADGELEPARAEAFREHLRTCAACRAGLVEAMQLAARLSGLAPRPRGDARAAATSESQEPPAPEPDAPPPPRSRPRRGRWLAAWSGAVAAAIAIVVLVHGDRPREGGGDAFAALTARRYDVRFALDGAAAHRPLRDEQRGGAAAAGGPVIPYAALDALQQRGDLHALAVARAINSESLTDVANQLRGLQATPSVRSDRAAIDLVVATQPTNRNDDLEPVLAELDALRGGSDLAARAARWNYALVLARLDLPLAAAQAFDAIADEREPGWSDEARARAAQARAQDGRKRWEDAKAAGQALAGSGTAISLDVVRRFPGVIRGYFYGAVCAAPSRERVEALAPVAAELDRVGARPGDRPVLGELVRRVASVDFRRRAGLAEACAQLIGGKLESAAARARLLDPDPAPEVADIALYAMLELEVVPQYLDRFRRIVARSGDPWWDAVLAQEEAAAAAQRGDWPGAERGLRAAQKRCTPAIQYRCLGLARRLGKLYQYVHRVPEALAVLHGALREARAAGEWGQALALVLRLADTERFNASIATARAYAGEAVLMSAGLPDNLREARQALVALAVHELDGRGARRQLDLVLHGAAPTLADANYLADIGRLDPRPGDLAELQGWLGQLRAGAAPAPGERAFADEIEGRLLIERDRAAGIALLERAIAAAAELPHDADAERARTGAYSVLTFEAARRGDHARVLALVARELDLPPPGPCTVAISAEDERAVVVVRDGRGEDLGRYQAARRAHDAPPVVSPELARGLDHCGRVGVMASPVLHGRPGILPPGVAWVYLAGRHGRTAQSAAAAASGAAAARRTVIVANVTPPDYVALPALAPLIVEPSPGTILLSGPAATPAAVLAELTEASEIQFHTHAMVDVGGSDASHLVLSPGTDGNYALTAEAIRGIELRQHPIVVLAACDSARGARYQHAPWSLPDAFLAVGARAVLAAGAAIPDREAAAWFARVLARIWSGADPAAALRDERVAALAADPSSWVANMIMFE